MDGEPAESDEAPMQIAEEMPVGEEVGRQGPIVRAMDKETVHRICSGQVCVLHYFNLR